MKKYLLAFLIFTSTLNASSQVSLHISPNGFVYTRHPTVHISTHIEKNASNRSATLELVSEDFYSKSDFEVPGEDAPINCSFDIRNLVAGEYVAYLTLHQVINGKVKNVTAESEKLTVLY